MLHERLSYLREEIASMKASDGFAQFRREELAEVSEQLAVLRSIQDATGGNVIGVELVRELFGNCDYVVVLEEPDGSGQGRLVRYDHRGPYGHDVHDSPQEALEQAIVQGYRERVIGAMDKLSATREWQNGVFITGLIQRVNDGLMTMEQFRATVSQRLAS